MEDDILQSAVTAATERYGAELSLFRGETRLLVPVEHIVDVVRTLRDEFGFDTFVDVTAVDYFPNTEPRFHVVYQLYSMKYNLRVQLRVPVNAVTPVVPTVETLFRGANWYEREVWDLFGIRFEGHSDLRRLVMPEDWVGHPLRKDYPVGYEEVQFTFNVDEVQLRKPRGKESYDG